jgi:phage-related protein (TIGR01555 family)
VSEHVNGGGPNPDKPRIRAPAGSSNDRLGGLTTDAVSNVVARLGIGTQNLLSGTTYDFTPITRMQQLLDWAYRGSWIVGAAVDCVADDMTRCGIQMNSSTPPEQVEQLIQAMEALSFWQSLNETIKWSRLYGGSLLVMQIDGQDMSTPLNLDSIVPGQLRGFLVVDRWMVQPTYSDIVLDLGPEYGLPKYYDMVATAPFMPRQKIHHTRCVRMDGIGLPFRQRLAENGWGMSVIERLYDRLIAFDSGTMGAAQLLYRAYIRCYKVQGYRQIVTTGGDLLEGFMRSMELMRVMQSNEGLSIIDAEDDFQTHPYNFGGLAETLMALGQQISGALGIPLVRLFGQSPAGMNSTGESDWRLYDSMIAAAQEARLRRPLAVVFEVLWRSELGMPPPATWGYAFRPIATLSEVEKSEIAQRDAATVAQLHGGGIISTHIALKELKQSSILTGRFTNITAADIEDSEEQPPPWSQEAQEQEMQMAQAGAKGGDPGGPGGGGGGGGGKPPGGGGGGLSAPKPPATKASPSSDT